jgi:hypothetical protein
MLAESIHYEVGLGRVTYGFPLSVSHPLLIFIELLNLRGVMEVLLATNASEYPFSLTLKIKGKLLLPEISACERVNGFMRIY